MTRASGPGSAFEVLVEVLRKQTKQDKKRIKKNKERSEEDDPKTREGWIWDEIVEHNPKEWKATKNRPARRETWLNSTPEHEYRISLNDYEPKKRGGAIRKDVHAILKTGSTHIENVILWKAPVRVPAGDTVDEIRFEEDGSEREESIPLVFLARNEQQRREDGTLGPPGKGVITISLTYGTEILDPRPIATASGERIKGKDFETYNNKPFYEFVIHYCPSGTMNHHFALHNAVGDAVVAHAASAPAEPEIAEAGPRTPEPPVPEAVESLAVEPVPLKTEISEYIPPTPQSQPVTSPGHSSFNVGQKRPRESSPSSNARVSRTPVIDSATLSLAKELHQKAQFSLSVAKHLMEKERAANAAARKPLEDNLKDYEKVLQRAVLRLARYDAPDVKHETGASASQAQASPEFRAEAHRQAEKLREDAEGRVENFKQLLEQDKQAGIEDLEFEVQNIRNHEKLVQVAIDRQTLYAPNPE